MFKITVTPVFMCGFLDNDTFYHPRPALGTEVMWCDVCVTEKNDVDAQNISSDGSINVTIYTVYSHTSVDWESVTLSVSVPILFGTEKKNCQKSNQYWIVVRFCTLCASICAMIWLEFELYNIFVHSEYNWNILGRVPTGNKNSPNNILSAGFPVSAFTKGILHTLHNTAP